MLSRSYGLLVCGLAMIALSATFVLAQPNAPQTIDSASSKTEVPATSDAKANTKQSQTEVEPKPAQTAESTKTVLDYEASEQISEDFAVSFPVDI